MCMLGIVLGLGDSYKFCVPVELSIQKQQMCNSTDHYVIADGQVLWGKCTA